MGKRIKFPEPAASAPALEELVKKVHKLSKESENVYWDCPHVQQRMRERNVSTRQMFDVLRNGKGIDGPSKDKYGDWRIKLKHFTTGRIVQVVVVVQNDYLEVITVI